MSKSKKTSAEREIDRIMRAAANGEPYDLDRARMKLLILCKNKNNLDASETFLLRRDWDIAVTSNLSELFQLMATYRPDFLLLSVNYPNSKITRLPAIVFQTFGTHVVAFGEASDTRTMQLMQIINTNYKMPGAVSGPNIQRRIKQIVQEIYSPPAMMAGYGHAAEDKAMGIVQSNGQSNEPEKSAGIQIFSSEKKDHGPGMIIAKGPAEIGGSRSRADTESKESKIENESLDQILNELYAEEGKEAEIFTITDINLTSDLSADTELGQAAREACLVEDTGATTDTEVMYEGSVTLSSFIRNAAIRTSRKKIKNHKPLLIATEALVVPIVFDNTRGVIILVQSGGITDRIHFEQKFLSELKNNQSHKHQVYVGNATRMYFEPTEINMAKGDKVVSFKAPNSSGEAGITFVESVEVNISTKKNNLGKAEVSVLDIVEECVIGADVYIHLPQNDKYFKIVSGSGWLSKDQKQRLFNAMTTVYIDATQVEQFKMSQAEARAVLTAKSNWRKSKKSA